MSYRHHRLRAIALVVGTALSLCGAGAQAAVSAADGTRNDWSDISIHVLYMQTGAVDTSTPESVGAFLKARRGAGELTSRHYVVQLSGPMRPAWRERMQDAGMEVGEYLPLNAFVVRLADVDEKKAAALEFVRWIGEYQRAWKLSPELVRPEMRRPFQTQGRVELEAAGRAVVVITVFRGSGADEVLAHLAPIGEVHWIEMIGGNVCVGATAPHAAVAALADLESVQFVEDAPDVDVRNDSDRWIVQTNVPQSTPLYDQGIRGEGQIAGLMDTRLDRNHCSFSDAQPIGPTHRKILAYNAAAGAEPHGTHVAGTLAGEQGSNNATRGVAYMAKIVFNTMPSFTEGSARAQFEQHHTQGARVHANSWGDDGTVQYNGLCRALDAFGRENEDDLLVFATTNRSNLRNPENAKNLVAVGATQDAPSQHQHCIGGIGPTLDSRRKPEIHAPGCGTLSAQSGTSCSVTSMTGTSMACPAIAGMGILMRQYYMDGFYPSGTRRAEDGFVPSGALLKATLLNSATDMTGVPGYPSDREGWGRVLADDALYFAGDTRTTRVWDVRHADGLSTGGEAERELMVESSAQPLKVTLAWTDVAATAGVTFASVNDLDLVVIGPEGEEYLGNVFGEGRSVPGGARDNRNNVEQVMVDAPSPGRYVVRVRATGVNEGMQGFALVGTGILAASAGDACRCDWNEDKVLNSSDFFEFLIAFFVGNADFNADGLTNSQDFFDYLNCFFAGCE